MSVDFQPVLAEIWHALGGPEELLQGVVMSGPRAVLPSGFDVTGLATASVAAATLAVAELHGRRRDSRPPSVSLDSSTACAAFAGEGLFTPLGWERPQLWDPIAGNYQTADGWIRLHTNYRHHRRAVEQVLTAKDRETVQAAVADWKAEDLEAAIVEAGGAAAVMHDRATWLGSAPGAATREETPVCATLTSSSPDIPRWRGDTTDPPLAGTRVLDLTRVIAGPDCTKVLAAYGAEVLRIDPPGFEEVAALLPETTVGKRTATLDLTTEADRGVFDRLIGDANVLIIGLRADALGRIGYDDAALFQLNPGLIVASLNAYGWHGPWQARRGFDSLVQMSCGIAAAPGRDQPTPLPVQALDHATGHLLAAAVVRAMTRQLRESVTSRIHASLIGTANLLCNLAPPDQTVTMPQPSDFPLEDTETAWGPGRRVPYPGRIAGFPARWSVEAGPLGRFPASWQSDGVG